MPKRAIIHVFLAIFFIVAVGCAAMGTPGHKYFMKGQVLEVSGGEAYVCIGSASGAKAGQELPVYRYVQTKTLGEKQRSSYRREPVGSIKITQVVDEHFANASVLKGDIRANDMAELMK
ncbi:MAG: hypothetical protein VR64_04250 [Desulfatitalea sp. BRH_c12]|nr:MAG: hypothetical protein VR64_04250 [Desulfatitalea sp. BRH_c12]